MIPLALRKHWPVLAVVLCALMLVALAGLQFAWTGQLSEAQAVMMQAALETLIRQFDQELGRELTYLSLLFQPDGRGGRGDVWSRYHARLELWFQTSSHARFVRRALVYSESGDGEWSLHEIPLGRAGFVEAQWESDLAVVRERLDRDARMPSGRDPRGLPWRLFPAVAAATRPLSVAESPRGEAARGPSSFFDRFLILLLDWSYVTESVLPDLVERTFAGPDGERLYEVAVATRRGKDLLYRSDESIDAKWLASADIRSPLRLVRELPMRGAGALSPVGIGRRRGPDGERDTRLREGERPEGGARRLPNAGRGRPFVVTDGGPVDLEIAATHVSGSLEAVVSRQRARNLGTGFGVLLVLGSAMVLVVVSARRAAQLAGMQIEFVAGVSHELRTPLSVICSVGENLADGVVGAGRQVERYGELIRDQGRRLAEMVEQTLQFAAMQSSKRQFLLESVDPAAAVESAIEQARPMIAQAGFSLRRGEICDLPPVRADEKALQQILANLLSNAVKYGEPGRWVRVEASREGRKKNSDVCIHVADGGMGIPESERGRIFDAFYRGATGGDRSIQGSGLGLSLARDLADGMGSRLSFRSKEGHGTVFTLRLPAVFEARA